MPRKKHFPFSSILNQQHFSIKLFLLFWFHKINWLNPSLCDISVAGVAGRIVASYANVLRGFFRVPVPRREPRGGAIKTIFKQGTHVTHVVFSGALH